MIKYKKGLSRFIFYKLFIYIEENKLNKEIIKDY